jgi:phosphoribosylformylglycinamidine synthase
VLAPVSLIVSAFAPVNDVRRTLTPQLRTDRGDSRLLLVDLGHGRNRLGGSCLAQVYGALGREAPDCDAPERSCASSRPSRVCATPDACSRTTIARMAGCS